MPGAIRRGKKEAGRVEQRTQRRPNGAPAGRQSGPLPARPQEQPGELPRRPLTKAQRRAREVAIQERIKQKRALEKQQQKQAKKLAREQQRRRRALEKQRAAQRRRQAAAAQPGALPNGVTPQRVSRTQARRSRKRRAVITAVLLLAFIAVGFLLSVTVLFKIENYRVEGDSIYTQDQIVAAFGHPVGENIFRFRLDDAASQLQQKLPYLETVKVRRRLPGTVVFFVTPATDSYYIDQNGSALLLSAGLRVLNTAGQAADGLCRLDGLTPASPVAGSTLTTGAADVDALVSTVLTAVRASGLTPVTEVDFTDAYELSLNYAGRIKVGLGTTAQLDYKLEVVKKTLENEYFTDTTTGTLDASDAGKAVFKPA